MLKPRLERIFLPFILLILVVAGCNESGSDRAKELELKEKELELKEKELELREKESNKAPEQAETPLDESENKEETEKPEPVRGVYTPKRNSPVRKQLMNTLRVPVERKLRQKIIFRVNDLKVYGDWAFLGGEPMARSGGKPNYRGTEFEEDVRSGMFDNNVFALFRKTGGRWTVVVHYIGCTDVCYAGWWKKHGAPKQIFPYTE